MRLILVPAVAAAALLALTGCSSDSDGGANADVCTQFAAAHNELAVLSTTGPGVPTDVDEWTSQKDAVIAKFEPLGEQASGDVQTGIQNVVSALPADSLELTEADSKSGQEFVDNSAVVGSSCESDGTSITLVEFPLQKFNG